MAERTVTTTGTGRTTASPDLATATIDARGGGETPKAARNQATGRAAEIREALKGIDITQEAIRTTSLQVTPRSELFEADENDPPFRATEELTIDCTPENAGDVAVAAADAGGYVSDIAFGLHETSRDLLQEQALEEAMQDARKQAETIATTEDSSLGNVKEVTTQEAHDSVGGLVEEAIGNTPEFDFQPDPIAITAEVRVVYELCRTN